MSGMNVNEIKNYLPHRYPFLLIDRVLECVEGEHLIGIKNVTHNEPFFDGHFPNQPVMPGVLIIEALAQATGLLGFRTMGEEPRAGVLYMLVGVDKARFKQQVIPGDQLVLSVTLKNRKGIIWVFDAKATVDNKVVASAELMCAAKEGAL